MPDLFADERELCPWCHGESLNAVRLMRHYVVDHLADFHRMIETSKEPGWYPQLGSLGDILFHAVCDEDSAHKITEAHRRELAAAVKAPPGTPEEEEDAEWGM